MFASPGNRSAVVTGNPLPTHAIVTGLINGTAYRFTVRATTGAGFSQVTTTTPVTPHDLSGRVPALFEPPNGQTYLGVSSSINDLDAFDQTVGISDHPAIFNSYTPYDGYFDQSLLDVEKFPGMTPMISWSVIMAGGLITSGSRDAYLAREATVLKTYGKPVFLRLDWEMNSGSYPTYDVYNGTTPVDYIESWDRIHSFFADVPNVAFVWSPMAGAPNPGNLSPFAWYPGDDEVDWIAADSYPDYLKNPIQAFQGQYGLNSFAAGAAAHRKPFMLAEWARGNAHSTADTGYSVNLVFDWAETYPNTVKALIYFDYSGLGQHDLQTHPVAASAFKTRTVGNPKYLLNLFAPA